MDLMSFWKIVAGDCRVYLCLSYFGDMTLMHLYDYLADSLGNLVKSVVT